MTRHIWYALSEYVNAHHDEKRGERSFQLHLGKALRDGASSQASRDAEDGKNRDEIPAHIELKLMQDVEIFDVSSQRFERDDSETRPDRLMHRKAAE